MLVLISAVFSIGAFFPYISAILKTRGTSTPMRPNRASWLVWFIIDVTMLVSLTAAGALSVVPMFAAFTIGSAIVLLLSVKNGEGGFTRFDLTCIAIAILGVVLWQILGDPNVSIVANITAAWAGTLPTIRKSWFDPTSEDLTTWLIFSIGGFFNCLAIREFTLPAVAPPISIFAAQVSIIVAILMPRQAKLAERG